MDRRTSPYTRSVAIFVAACLWMLGIPQSVVAAPTADEPNSTAAILPLVVEGDLSEADRTALTRQLVDGLRRGAFNVIDPEALQASQPDAAKCNKPRCFRQIAVAAKATHVVRARVKVIDRDYAVTLELLDGASGESVAKTAEACEICGVSDAGDLVDIAAATLRTKLDALAKGPSTLVLSSNPAGAEVRLDGEIAGTTPLERAVIPGKRLVRVTKEGYIAVEREVTFVEGVSEKVSFELEKVPSRLPSRPWGWVSLGVGVAALGGAVTFALLDHLEVPYRVGGKCEGENKDAQDECKFVWNASLHTLGLGVAGASLTTLGIAVLLNSRARKRESGEGTKRGRKRGGNTSARRARVGVGPGSVAVSGRF